MKTKWSKTWNASVQPRRQRKYLANAPLHVKQKLVSVHLEKKLREKMKKRALPVRKGDEVKVLRGKRKGIKAKVSAVDLSKGRVYLEAQTRDTIRGLKAIVPFAPSNLLLISMVDDKRRNKQGRKIVKTKPEKPEKKETKSVKKSSEKKEKSRAPKVESAKAGKPESAKAGKPESAKAGKPESAKQEQKTEQKEPVKEEKKK